MKKFKALQTLGYLISDIPQSLVDTIMVDIDAILVKKENKTINHRSYALSMTLQEPIPDYYLSKSVIPLNNYIKTLVPEYLLSHGEEFREVSKLPYYILENGPRGKKAAWVNINKKNEYVLPHIHRGLLSFVIWLKIPYDLKEELLHLETTNNISDILPGFAFIHQNQYQGQAGFRHHVVSLDKTFENKIILFPATLPHYVIPFQTSDEYRISVAGNIASTDNFKWPI